MKTKNLTKREQRNKLCELFSKLNNITTEIDNIKLELNRIIYNELEELIEDAKEKVKPK